jgi:hypothetical protein
VGICGSIVDLLPTAASRHSPPCGAATLLQTQEKCKSEGDCSCECCQCDMSDPKAVQKLADMVAGMNVDIAIFK